MHAARRTSNEPAAAGAEAEELERERESASNLHDPSNRAVGEKLKPMFQHAQGCQQTSNAMLENYPMQFTMTLIIQAMDNLGPACHQPLYLIPVSIPTVFI